MLKAIQHLLLGTLRRQLIVGLTLIFTLTIALFVWDITYRQQSVELKRQSEQIHSLAETVATSSAVWVGARDFSGLQNIVEETVKYPELNYVIVLDVDGQVLAHSDASRRGLYMRDLPKGSVHQALQITQNLISVTQPIMLANKHVGWVRIGLSRSKLNTSMEKIKRSGVMYALLANAFAILVALMAGRYLTRRLYKIQRVADAVQLGMTDKRVLLHGDDEAAQLAQQFNNMLDVLAEREEAFSGTFNQAAVGLAHVGLDGALLRVNQKLCEIVGYSNEELSTRSFQDITHPDDVDIELEYVRQMLAGTIETYQLEKRYIHQSTAIIWVNLTVSLMRHKDGSPNYFISVVEDISERKLADIHLRIAATVFESHEGMLVTDANCQIVSVNRAFAKITGYAQDEVAGKNPRILSSGRQDRQFYEAMWDSIMQAGSWEGEIWNRRKNGEVYPAMLTITAVKDDQDVVLNYVSTMTDITINKAVADEIKSLAFYDPLTQLPNRRLLMDRLSHALTTSMRKKQHGAVLFLDLDHFKTLNDTLGHEVGDLLLQQVAERLLANVRETDTVARLGGDEFVVIMENLSHKDVDSAAKVEVASIKLLAAVSAPYQLESSLYYSSSSIGVTLFGGERITADEVLKQADIAMYQAKSDGRNAIRFFNPTMQQAINERVALENDLRYAIEQQQFELYYQIQVDEAQRPLGAEALIRWHHPVRGLMCPASFIELAEEVGLILPIGQWVLEAVCSQLKSWLQNPLTQHLSLSLNVSAKQFAQPNFVQLVKNTITHQGINPERLNLELTESLLLTDVEGTIATMSALKEIGVRFELDDFGTGYSSLQYLKQLPLSQLKIDQSFVRNIVTDSNDLVIVQTIIAMAKSLRLSVIAEGVETDAQRQYLLNMGCKRHQGYLFGRPMPIGEFESKLAQTS